MKVIEAQIDLIKFTVRQIAMGKMPQSALDDLFADLITAANINCLNDDIDLDGYRRLKQDLLSKQCN